MQNPVYTVPICTCLFTSSIILGPRIPILGYVVELVRGHGIADDLKCFAAIRQTHNLSGLWTTRGHHDKFQLQISCIWLLVVYYDPQRSSTPTILWNPTHSSMLMKFQPSSTLPQEAYVLLTPQHLPWSLIDIHPADMDADGLAFLDLQTPRVCFC